MGKMGKTVKSKVASISNIPTNDLGMVQPREVNKVQEHTWKHIPNTHEVVIKCGEEGFSYKRLFVPLLNSSVTKIVLEDPYLEKEHQITNLKEFLSLCTNECPALTKLHIVTNLYDIDEFEKLKGVYKKQNLTWKKDKTLHDRYIWLFTSETKMKISLTRGLDIYQFNEYDRFEKTLNQDEMKCKKTTITVTEYSLEKSNIWANNMPKRKSSSVIPTGEKAQAA